METFGQFVAPFGHCSTPTDDKHETVLSWQFLTGKGDFASGLTDSSSLVPFLLGKTLHKVYWLYSQVVRICVPVCMLQCRLCPDIGHQNLDAIALTNTTLSSSLGRTLLI